MRDFKKYAAIGILALLVVAGFLACSNGGILNAFKNDQKAPVAAAYPAGKTPDGVILTPGADPATMQTVNWRTFAANTNGVVRYREVISGGYGPYAEKTAEHHMLEMPELANDALNSRFTVTLANLRPGGLYEYYIGSGPNGDGWTGPYRFKMAPAYGEPFSFFFLGDIQRGIASVAAMLNDVNARYPEAGFYMLAGDIVNIGSDRNAWDTLVTEARDFFAAKTIAPALGNHDLSGGDNPRIYFHYFKLPLTGPGTLPPNRAYSFAYGDAYFFVLDSNDKVAEQAAWLKNCLATPEVKRYKWKIVMFHHPVYNIKPSRKKTLMEKTFVNIFDEFKVDLVLNGHDHGYMRSFKLYNGKAVQSDAPGTYYVVANAGTKFYDVEHLDKIAAITVGGVQMYQKIDISQDENGAGRLVYKAYDINDRELDGFEIVK